MIYFDSNYISEAKKRAKNFGDARARTVILTIGYIPCLTGEKFNNMATSNTRFCRFCANHNISSPIINHRGNCLFSSCGCTKCTSLKTKNERDKKRRQDSAAARRTINNASSEVVPNMLNAQQKPPQSNASKRAGLMLHLNFMD